MSLFVVSFIIIALAVGGMAIGVMNGRGAIRGSCGGLNARGGNCGSCGRDVSRCPARRESGK